MKKLIYIVLAALTLAACDKKETPINYAQTAAQDAAGTYEGTWMEISSFTGDTTYNTGTITIAPVNDTTAYFCSVTIANPTADWKSKTGEANVAHAGASGDLVLTNCGTNAMGTSFAGRVYGNGGILFSCALASKVVITPTDGSKPYKKNVIVAYTFTGKKQ